MRSAVLEAAVLEHGGAAGARLEADAARAGWRAAAVEQRGDDQIVAGVRRCREPDGKALDGRGSPSAHSATIGAAAIAIVHSPWMKMPGKPPARATSSSKWCADQSPDTSA